MVVLFVSVVFEGLAELALDDGLRVVRDDVRVQLGRRHRPVRVQVRVVQAQVRQVRGHALAVHRCLPRRPAWLTFPPQPTSSLPSFVTHASSWVPPCRRPCPRRTPPPSRLQPRSFPVGPTRWGEGDGRRARDCNIWRKTTRSGRRFGAGPKEWDCNKGRGPFRRCLGMSRRRVVSLLGRGCKLGHARRRPAGEHVELQRTALVGAGVKLAVVRMRRGRPALPASDDGARE